MFYSPLAFIFMVFLFVIVGFFFTMVQIDILAVVFERIGIPSHHVISALLASFLGSLINIPVKIIPQHAMTTQRRKSYFGFRYNIPATQKDYTIIAVNVGGAIVPVCISAYLLLKTGLYFQSMIATGCIALAAYRMAKPIPGVGIALPFFLTPILAAIISVIIAYNSAPVVAYISGSLGTLIGADILNLQKISHLGAPIASIGGAGTFDGIFLSGILAVILSALLV
jgi:uncharacterized membrane protein